MTKENNVDHSTEIKNNKWHNRAVSFEQYEKILKSYRHLLKYSSQQMRRCKSFLDEAFTKYPQSNSSYRKLKDFEIHESRNHGIKIADEFNTYCDQKIDKIDEIANEFGYEIEKKQETITLGGTEIPIQDAYSKEDNDE